MTDVKRIAFCLLLLASGLAFYLSTLVTYPPDSPAYQTATNIADQHAFNWGAVGFILLLMALVVPLLKSTPRRQRGIVSMEPKRSFQNEVAQARRRLDGTSGERFAEKYDAGADVHQMGIRPYPGGYRA